MENYRKTRGVEGTTRPFQVPKSGKSEAEASRENLYIDGGFCFVSAMYFFKGIIYIYIYIYKEISGRGLGFRVARLGKLKWSSRAFHARVLR